MGDGGDHPVTRVVASCVLTNLKAAGTAAGKHGNAWRTILGGASRTLHGLAHGTGRTSPALERRAPARAFSITYAVSSTYAVLPTLYRVPNP
jgi:hypothetical protein